MVRSSLHCYGYVTRCTMPTATQSHQSWKKQRRVKQKLPLMSKIMHRELSGYQNIISWLIKPTNEVAIKHNVTQFTTQTTSVKTISATHFDSIFNYRWGLAKLGIMQFSIPSWMTYIRPPWSLSYAALKDAVLHCCNVDVIII